MRATKNLLARLGSPTLQDGEHSTTLLGQWYATALPWKPQVALLVNEPTLLPVLMPLAHAATLLARIPRQIATVLAAHGTPQPIIDDELQHMREHRITGTSKINSAPAWSGSVGGSRRASCGMRVELIMECSPGLRDQSMTNV